MAARPRSKRGWQTWILLADTQTGSVTGLTTDPTNPIQDRLLEHYHDAIAWAGKADVVVHVGDAIHGTDPKGHDVDCDDPLEQSEDAARLLNLWKSPREFIIVTGTPYHTSLQGFALESKVADHLKSILPPKTARVSVIRKLNTLVNGWFHLEARHKIGRSVVPYGRRTSPERAKTWNVLNAALRSANDGKAAHWPDLCVYAHVHYCGDSGDPWGRVMTLPCWQAIGSRYGDEECEGRVDIGLVKLSIGPTREDGWTWEYRLYEAVVGSRVERR